MLRWMVSLLGIVSGAGCKRAEVAAMEKAKAPEYREYTFEFPTTEQIVKDLIGDRDPMTIAHEYTFAPPLRIAHRDEPVDGTAYVAMTMPDGTAVTGKYAFKAILRSGYTGGPPGSATEKFVEIDDVHLMEKLKPPVAPKGVKGIVPGQGVLRRIPPDTIAGLDDRYIVELPARAEAVVWLLPRRHEYDLKVAVSKGAESISTVREPEDQLYTWNSYRFRTNGAGVYEISVRADKTSVREPSGYLISVGFGNTLGLAEGAGRRFGITVREHASRPDRATGKQ